MSLKPSKSFIGMSSLNIVGWKLSKTGVDVNPDKLQAIHDYQFPLSKKSMRRFLGMANQYRIHIPMYAHIAKSLSALTKNAVPVNWTLAKVPEDFAKTSRKIGWRPHSSAPLHGTARRRLSRPKTYGTILYPTSRQPMNFKMETVGTSANSMSLQKQWC